MNKDDQKILNKISEWAEKLPYRHLKIEITLKDGTELAYERERQNPIGFRVDERGKS